MTQVLNGAAETKLDPLVSLAGHLTEPQDRETYAALVSYLHSLPPGDEFRRLAELLGLLSLLGQRLPDALSGFLEALREETKAADLYHAKLDERLAKLPREVSAGVDPGAIAKAMSESFRQQIAAVGIEESARTLRASAAGLKKLADEIPGYLKPLTTISAELRKVTNASAELRQQNVALVSQVAEERWEWKALICFILPLVGFLAGLVFEKRSTGNLLADLQGQITRIQQKLPAQETTADTKTAAPRRSRSGK